MAITKTPHLLYTRIDFAAIYNIYTYNKIFSKLVIHTIICTYTHSFGKVEIRGMDNAKSIHWYPSFCEHIYIYKACIDIFHFHEYRTVCVFVRREIQISVYILCKRKRWYSYISYQKQIDAKVTINWTMNNAAAIKMAKQRKTEIPRTSLVSINQNVQIKRDPEHQMRRGRDEKNSAEKNCWTDWLVSFKTSDQKIFGAKLC